VGWGRACPGGRGPSCPAKPGPPEKCGVSIPLEGGRVVFFGGVGKGLNRERGLGQGRPWSAIIPRGDHASPGFANAKQCFNMRVPHLPSRGLTQAFPALSIGKRDPSILTVESAGGHALLGGMGAARRASQPAALGLVFLAPPTRMCAAQCG